MCTCSSWICVLPLQTHWNLLEDGPHWGAEEPLGGGSVCVHGSQCSLLVVVAKALLFCEPIYFYKMCCHLSDNY